MKNKNALIISICIFCIVGILALLLVLNKGHIGSRNLVDTSGTPETIKPKLEISIDNEYLSIKDDDEATLNAVIDGETITEGIEYISSDDEIAKIDNGKVIPVNDGKVTITGKYEGMEDSVDVHIITPIKTMKFTSTSSSIRVGKELQMKLQVTPSDAFVGKLKYTSSDEEIATVNANGIVTGVSAGKVVITVTDEYTGMEKSVNLTIK